MALRLTKQQRAYQETILAAHGFIDEFKPCSTLVGELAFSLDSRTRDLKRVEAERVVLTDALYAERSKPLWRIVKERLFK